jgi:hypothetical protein
VVEDGPERLVVDVRYLYRDWRKDALPDAVVPRAARRPISIRNEAARRSWPPNLSAHSVNLRIGDQFALDSQHRQDSGALFPVLSHF